MSEPQATVQPSRQQEVYSKFRGGSPLSTELALLELLQDTYPDHHVTLVGRDGWDFKGFAAAGVAECQIEKVDDFYHAIRSYQKDPGPRLGLGAGKLVDTVKYGRWNYVWQNHEYLIYEIDQAGHIPRRPQSSPLFILNSHVDEKQNKSDITLIDQLLIAVGEWSCAIHDEIYVYDNGCWRKSSDLWKTVQDSAWEDVILPSDMKASLMEDVTGFFDNKNLYKKLAVPWKRGLIFHGVP
jgi:transitional endoplasmic reticulum ATPase